MLNDLTPSIVVGPIRLKHLSFGGAKLIHYLRFLKSPLCFSKAFVPYPLIICLIWLVSITYFGFGGRFLPGFLQEILFKSSVNDKCNFFLSPLEAYL